MTRRGDVKSRGRLLRVLLKAVVSAGLLTVVFLFVPIRSVVAGLQNVHVGYALAALAITPLSLYAAAARIRIFARRLGLTLTVGKILRIGYATQFYGLFLPGIIAGGAVRWYKFAQHDGRPVEALTTITFGRLSSLLFAVGVGLLAWSADPVARRQVALGVGLAVALLAIACAYWLLLHRELALKTAALVTGLPRVPARWKHAVNRVIESTANLRGLGSQFGLIALFGVLEQGAAIASDALFARAAGMELELVSIAWVRAYQLLIALLPITLGGFGAREAGMIVLLAGYGVSPEVAVTYSLLIFGRRLFSASLGAVFELWDFFKPERAAGQRGPTPTRNAS